MRAQSQTRPLFKPPATVNPRWSLIFQRGFQQFYQRRISELGR